MTMVIAFIVEGKPVAKQSVRATRHGTFYTPAHMKEWQDLVSLRAREAMAEKNLDPFTGQVEVQVDLYLPDFKKIDPDNMSKAILDGMNGIVFDDDNQVWELHIHKKISKDDPRADVWAANMMWCAVCDETLSDGLCSNKYCAYHQYMRRKKR